MRIVREFLAGSSRDELAAYVRMGTPSIRAAAQGLLDTASTLNPKD